LHGGSRKNKPANQTAQSAQKFLLPFGLSLLKLDEILDKRAILE
jgi:hypothetical protein